MSRNIFKIALLLKFVLAASVAQAVTITSDLEVVIVPNVGNVFQTIALENNYNNAIPVCTYNLPSNTAAAATVRITSITANSFKVRIQNPSNGAVTAGDVHCLISDEGAYTLPDGLRYEARIVVSNGVNGKDHGWDKDETENVTKKLSFKFRSPIVLGQVITSNDNKYSTFWSHGGDRRTPPKRDKIYVGKQVGFDEDDRDDELLGYIVIESGTGSGNINGVDYASAVGSDSIVGVTSSAVSYSLSRTFDHGIATQTAMDAKSGGWAVLLGESPLANAAISLGIDEDNNRSHGSEQVAYWVFDAIDVADLAVTIDDGSATYAAGDTVAYTLTVENNGPNEAALVNIINSAPAETTIVAWRCSGANCPNPTGEGDIDETADILLSTDTLVYTVNVAIPSDRAGDLVNTASVSNVNTDPVSANNTASDIDSQLNTADIIVSVDDASATYTPGEEVLYNIVVKNNGPSDANDIVITNAQPDGAIISSWTCSGARCPNASGIGDVSETVLKLLSGESLSYVITVSVPSVFIGDLINVTTAIAIEFDPLTANNTVIDSNFSSIDADGDGILDSDEIGSDPLNPIDTDKDDVPDYLENNALDTDEDGVLNYMDANDDGDSLLTADELGPGGALNPADSNNDGIPNYLSYTIIIPDVEIASSGATLWLFISVLFLFLLREREKNKKVSKTSV